MGFTPQDSAETPGSASAEPRGQGAPPFERGSGDIATAPPFKAAPPGRAYEVLTPGDRFGTYQIACCLSYDLLGSLYRIEPLRGREEQPPSLFVLPPLVEHDKAFRKRFKSEATKLCRFDHENILAYSEPSEIDGRLCFKLDHFEGQNLIDYLETVVSEQDLGPLPEDEGDQPMPDLMGDKASGLPLEEVRAILRQLASAVEYAHRRGFRHLSLNPTNMLRDRHTGQIKVLGFGLLDITGTKLFDELASAGIPPISIGKVRMRVNTVDILSPEVRLGRPGDGRSDIYALGITTYWLLTGRKPTSDYLAPSAVNPAIPGHWDALVAKCLERDPDNRYQSGSALLRDLDGLEQIGRHEVRDPGTAETRSVFRHIDFIPVPKALERRSRTAARALRLSILGLVGVGLVGAAQYFTAGLFEEPPPPPPPTVSKPTPGFTPNTTFRIEPPNAQVLFPAQDISFVTRNGRLSLYVAPGERTVRVVSPNYQEAELVHTFTAARQELPVTLKPRWSTLELTGLPGTRVKAHNLETDEVFDLGTIGAGGSLAVEQTLYAGSYNILLDKADHHSRTLGDLTLPVDETVQADGTLEPMSASLRVVSEPAGAQVFAGPRLLGTTPLELNDLPPGELLVLTVSLQRYRPSTLKVRPQPNGSETVRLPPLELKTGSIEVGATLAGRAPTPEQWEALTVSLPEAEIGGPDRRAFSGLAFDTYTVRLEHPDYFPAEVKATVDSEAAPARVSANLRPRPARLRLSANRPGEIELFHGDKRLEPAGDGTYAIPPLTEVSLQARVKDFYHLNRTVRFEPNADETWELALKRLPGPETAEPYTVPYVGESLVWVPPGTGTIGTPLREHARLPTEGPQTEARFSKGFWMGRTEVTQRAYAALTGENPSSYVGADLPVANLSWNQARAFCARLTSRERQAGRLPEGYVYRLPTEAEWEYAARGGPSAGESLPFHFGAEASARHGRFMGIYPRDYNVHVEPPESPGPVPVGRYDANDLGLHDLHGNVAEWCHDRYGSRLPGGTVTDYAGPEEGSKRVVRGGGWRDDATEARLGARGDGVGPETTDANIGFRVVLAPAL